MDNIIHSIAVIGFGGMGGHHCRCIMKMPQFKLSGIYDVREEMLREAERDGIKAYASLDEVLNDETVETVLIATPNNFHKPLCEKALKSGKNVILEKPAVLCSKDYEELYELSKAHRRLLTVHQNRRWDSDYNTIKSIIDNNILGEAYMLESRVQGSRQVLHGWRGVKENGGGMVYDWGVHLVDQILNLSDSKLISVYAELFSIYTDEVDDNFKAMLKFDSGLSALVEVSMNCFILHPRWHLSCKNGTAVIEDWDLNGKLVKLSENAEDIKWDERIVYTSAGPTRSMLPRPVETTDVLPLPVVNTSHLDFYNNFADALEGKCKEAVNFESELRTLKAIDLIFESARQKKSISCNV